MKIVWNRSIGFNMSINGFEKFSPNTFKPMEISYIINGADCYPWTECYAWLPVKTVYGKYVWRKKVYKRKVWAVWGTGFHMEPVVQYATAFDLLTYSPEER